MIGEFIKKRSCLIDSNYQMRILFINTVPTKYNGITNVIFNLLENMNSPELQFGYLSINPLSDEYIERLNNLKCNYHIVPRKITAPFSYIYNLKRIASNYDCIHVHGNSATMVLEMIAAKIAGVKYRIAHSHSTKCQMKYVDKIMRPLFYKLCNFRFACGEEAGKWLFKDREFTIINNGVNTEKFIFDATLRDKVRNSLGWQDKFIIGHVGNFVEVKNHIFIIHILRAVSKNNENVCLLCLGGGPLIEEIKNLASSFGLKDFVHFTGSVNNPEYYLSAMDVMVMPSLYEGFPLSLVEEQANGLNCIVSENISHQTNITGNIQFLSLSDSSEIWGDKLLELSIQNSDVRTKRSKTSISMIKEKGFDISTEAEKLCDFYRRTLS